MFIYCADIHRIQLCHRPVLVRRPVFRTQQACRPKKLRCRRKAAKVSICDSVHIRLHHEPVEYEVYHVLCFIFQRFPLDGSTVAPAPWLVLCPVPAPLLLV